MHDEAFNTAHAYLAVVNAEENGGPLTPAELEWIDAGIGAGYVATLEMLIRRGMLKSTDAAT